MTSFENHKIITLGLKDMSEVYSKTIMVTADRIIKKIKSLNNICHHQP